MSIVKILYFKAKRGINHMKKAMSVTEVQEELMTPQQASTLKGVSRAAIYAAISTGRLQGIEVLGRMALRKAEVLAWQPAKYLDRPGRTAGLTGKRKGTLQTDEAKRRISESQKLRWARRKEKMGQPAGE